MNPLAPERIEGWLREMGLQPRRIEEQTAIWAYVVGYPSPPRQMLVINPKSKPRAVIIATELTLLPQHHEAFGRFSDDAKRAFHIDLQETLNRDYVEYLVREGPNRWQDCPAGFQTSSVIFDDALTLDSLALRLSATFRAQIAGFLCVERHFGRSPAGGTGTFDFTPTGRQ